MRKFDLSLRSSRSSYFATFRHQLTILSKTDALDEEKWLNMLGTFVKDWFRYESHFVHGRDSLVDILKERGLLSESDAVQPLIGKKSYFMQRYHDVISSFGGKTSYDADNRPLLVMRSNLWASGYDVDGTDQTSLGQFSGRVQQTYKHSVPRFFVPEHGTMFTLALVRFPPTATKEIQYLNAKGALTYTDIAGDPVL